MMTLQDLLNRHVQEGELYEKLPEDKVRCYACGHRCPIPEGRQGVCKVRFNEGGKLFVPWGYIGKLQLDPIEKKPFFHAYPGTAALSFGMLGCDYHCSFCHNWQTSQTLRDSDAGVLPQEVTPEGFVALAGKYGARVVTSTYNEPLITSEWAVEIFKIAKSRGLITSYVSNGNGTPEVLDYIHPWVDLYKVDLKSFDDKHYRSLGGVIDQVLETIKMLVEKGFWLEVVTLVIPGFNDSTEELRSIAEFLVSVSPNIPWHVTAFHKDYKMQDPDNTPTNTLVRAAKIGYEMGLNFVYAGNIPGRVGNYENTYCPKCKSLLIERYGFQVLRNNIRNSSCPNCYTPIPGRWDQVSTTTTITTRPLPIV